MNGSAVQESFGAAALEHLTGPSSGAVTWLSATDLDVILGRDRFVRVAPSHGGAPPEDMIARFHRLGDTYEIVAHADASIWVNGVEVGDRTLKAGDVIEFGDSGPMSRFCLHGDGRQRKSGIEIVRDVFAYMRASRRPIFIRLCRAAMDLARKLARETTVIFRLSVLIAIAALAVVTWQQSRVDVRLEAQIESGSEQLQTFAGALRRAREEALIPADLEMLRQELGEELTTAAERLASLERRTGASARIIADSAASIVFLQGAYGFRHSESGRMLRLAVNEAGAPRLSPAGQPLLTLEGDGPVAERQFTGTGFAAGSPGQLVTNRHVALPWEGDATRSALAGQGLKPVMVRFIAYRVGQASADDVSVLVASEDADLAVLRLAEGAQPLKALPLAERTSAQGEEVLVMGFPTGLRAMLAQAGGAFVRELQAAADTNFWSVAKRLSAGGHIAPLASRGIVSQVARETIAYDAETTHGGSGGPVLNVNGAVVAVNTAILPEFGGSNLGIPVTRVIELLESVGS